MATNEPMLNHAGRPNLDHGFKVKRYGYVTDPKYGGLQAGPHSFLVYSSLHNPGNYFDENGKPVTEDIARLAGFDVDADLAEKERQARLEKARQEIDAEFRKAAAENIVVAERGGYKLVDAGLGRVNLITPDGERVNPKPFSRAEGEKYLDAMVLDGSAA